MTLRSAACILALLAMVSSFASPVAAQLVSTSQALELEEGGEGRRAADADLAREEVLAGLISLGVDPEVARWRVAALSAAELDELAGKLGEAPAGGVGVIGVLGVTFLVLLVLEIVGVIDIFKKV